jgi:GPH family glycoside/pentoside/hexuronide:cation symporter
MTSYTLCIALGAIIGAYVVRYLVKKFDTRTITIGAYIGMAVFLFLIYICYSNPVLVIALMTCAQFFYGMALASSPALYADTVVYATWKTGKNAAGWIMGLQNLPLKIGVFLRGTIVSACLAATGWQSGVVLEGAARQGMTVAFALVPAIFCAIGAVLLLFCYNLTKARVAQYQAEIDARS